MKKALLIVAFVAVVGVLGGAALYLDTGVGAAFT